jgi:hypothetical protein
MTVPTAGAYNPRAECRATNGTSGLFPPRPVAAILNNVEGISPAHELPELYRAVLERVGSLELTGHRREGELIRREAVAAYSRAWDDAARRRLEQLRHRAERVLGGQERPRVDRTTGALVRRPGTA